MKMKNNGTACLLYLAIITSPELDVLMNVRLIYIMKSDYEISYE